MRDNVRAFVAATVEAFDLRGPVYEFGSYQVDGQQALADLRGLFPGRSYVGCDMRSGPGVDRVEDLAQLTLPDDVAETIICVDTLEHVFEVRRAVDELLRVLAPGGVILLAAPMDFRIHDFPSDYWRLTPSCLSRLLAPLEATIVGWQGVESHPHTVLAVGCKSPVPERFARGLSAFAEGFQSRLDALAATVPWPRRIKKWAGGWWRGKGERRRERDYYRAQFAMQVPMTQAAAPDRLRELLSSR